MQNRTFKNIKKIRGLAIQLAKTKKNGNELWCASKINNIAYEIVSVNVTAGSFDVIILGTPNTKTIQFNQFVSQPDCIFWEV